ncbi:MAG: hypothetical protein AB8B69_20690, partial [Chitinophagales bacterium]
MTHFNFFLSLCFFSCCNVFAQIDLLSVSSLTFNISEELNLSDYSLIEEEVTGGDEMVLMDVMGYREMPSYTTDEFDLDPVVYDFLGEVDYDIKEEENDALMELGNSSATALDVEMLENRAIHGIIAPPCGSNIFEIYSDDFEIGDNMCVMDLPIKADDPYLLELRSDKSISLLSDASFGIEVGKLVLSGAEKTIRGRRYENVPVSFDTFGLQPVTIKVYDKWGELVEVLEGNTGEVVELNTSTYWWGHYWVST